MIRRTAELPEEAQAEVVELLVAMRSQHLGIYRLDDDEREALARSGEDDRLGRYADASQIVQVFAKHGA